MKSPAELLTVLCVLNEVNDISCYHIVKTGGVMNRFYLFKVLIFELTKTNLLVGCLWK